MTRVHLLFELVVPEVRQAVDGGVGLALGKTLAAVRQTIRGFGFDPVKLIYSDIIRDSGPTYLRVKIRRGASGWPGVAVILRAIAAVIEGGQEVKAPITRIIQDEHGETVGQWEIQ